MLDSYSELVVALELSPSQHSRQPLSCKQVASRQ